MGFKPRAPTKSPLTAAAYDGDLAAVKRLIAAGADVQGDDNARWFGDADGCIDGAPYYRPLSEAARGGHPDVVRALIDAGAEVDALQYRSESALQLAASRGRAGVVEILLAAGARATTGDLEAACCNTPTDRRASYSKTIEILVRDAAADVLGPRAVKGVLASFEHLPPALGSKLEREKDKSAEWLGQLESLARVWPLDDRQAIDALLETCGRARGDRIAAETKSASALRARASADALADPGWEQRIAKLIGAEIDERRVPQLRELCENVLAAPAAVAHEAWPRLVKKLMDLTVDFESLTEDIFGEAIHPNDDESGTMEAVNDDHMYSVDLVLELLASDAALASPSWDEVFEYVCEEKRRKLGYMSFGDDEVAALFAKPSIKGRRGIKALRELARKAWPFAGLVG